MPEDGHQTITVAEAGRRGGKKTFELYGREYYSEIARQARRDGGDPEERRERGRKAGQTTLARHGKEHYQEMARRSALARTKPSVVDD